MGNCLFKPKSNYCERLETEIFYLQKENLRSYDLFLRELKSLKSSVQKLELPISSTLNEPQKITYVWTVLRVLITILTDYLFILSSDLSVYPIIIPTYYVIFHQSVNSIIIFTDYLFILSSKLSVNPIIISTYYVIFHHSVNSIIIFTDYLFILSSDLPINKNTKKI